MRALRRGPSLLGVGGRIFQTDVLSFCACSGLIGLPADADPVVAKNAREGAPGSRRREVWCSCLLLRSNGHNVG
jgi:hypothetical protein